MPVRFQLNGESRDIPGPLTIREMLAFFELPAERVAVERNHAVVPRSNWNETRVEREDRIEVVQFVGGGQPVGLVVAGRSFASRLIVGTGKYPSNEVMAEAHKRSGADMVTVAVRRVELKRGTGQSLLDFIDPGMTILPNTAGCYTADDAVRTARLGREAGLSNWVKLEVIGDEQTLFPDTAALVEATRILVGEGFVVLPYTNDDLVVARRLIDAGAAAIMPLGAPIGSGMGIQNVAAMTILRERITEVPLIVDAGVGTASDAVVAMELGADGVLMNTAIAGANDPPSMAEAMNLAVRSGRLAYEAGRIPKKLYASASSPVKGLVG